MGRLPSQSVGAEAEGWGFVTGSGAYRRQNFGRLQNHSTEELL